MRRLCSMIPPHNDLIALCEYSDIILYDTHDLPEKKEIQRIRFDAVICSVAISPCGTLVVVALKNGLIEMWSLQNKKFLQCFHGHRENASTILFSLCGSFLISGSHDGTIKIWDVTTGMCKATLDCGRGVDVSGDVTALTLLHGGKEVLAGTWDGKLIVLEMDGVVRRKFHQKGRNIYSLSCAGDGVVVLLDDRRLQLRRTANLKYVVWTSQVQPSYIYDICVSSCETKIVTIDEDATRVISAKTGKTLTSFKENTRCMYRHVKFLSTSKLISIAETRDGTNVQTKIQIWDLYPEKQKLISALFLAIHLTNIITDCGDTFFKFAQNLKRIMFV